MISAVQSFFQNGQMLRSFNHTQIVLIPKIRTPTQVSQFRPISLFNVFYKIIAKALANRLHNILPNLISLNQSAFVKIDIFRIIFLMHKNWSISLKNKNSRRDGHMAIELDIAKAYDCVEWTYLEKVMKHMGIADKWVCWIMNCISTLSYSITVNGQQHGFIEPSRGLRQGDPLSLYSFLLCAEGLSSMLKK